MARSKTDVRVSVKLNGGCIEVLYTDFFHQRIQRTIRITSVRRQLDVSDPRPRCSFITFAMRSIHTGSSALWC